jgi:hypothetical protein
MNVGDLLGPLIGILTYKVLTAFAPKSKKIKKPEPEYCGYRGGCNNIWVACINGLCEKHCNYQGCRCYGEDGKQQ